jgi:hypothetical protein
MAEPQMQLTMHLIFQWPRVQTTTAYGLVITELTLVAGATRLVWDRRKLKRSVPVEHMPAVFTAMVESNASGTMCMVNNP